MGLSGLHNRRNQKSAIVYQLDPRTGQSQSFELQNRRRQVQVLVRLFVVHERKKPLLRKAKNDLAICRRTVAQQQSSHVVNIVDTQQHRQKERMIYRYVC